ncbi:hypothetical protein [Diaminobutyricimonas sp. LJ205]|uniref:hypothetical protein n=1 Tax=Diaminobutyricimonas sp. LJ205 TaxID=2683590 RepID=UPI0012F49CBC|nr:hypothetical protein [Diaminobutyricimonas sp. LJ205]
MQAQRGAGRRGSVRFLAAIAVASVASVSLAGCGATIERLPEGSLATWQVGVVHPSPPPPNACADDPAVESSLQSLDLPSSHYGYSLIADATESDAERVADCIAAGISSGNITIAPPASE